MTPTMHPVLATVLCLTFANAYAQDGNRVPAECVVYFSTAQVCVNQLAKSERELQAFSKAMNDSLLSMQQVDDNVKEQLKSACIDANKQFRASAEQMGCHLPQNPQYDAPTGKNQP